MPSSSEPHDRLPPEIAEDILRKYFLLTDSDLSEVEQCRGSVNRLGFAVQLCTLRWRGYFLPDTSDLPLPVLETLASQLRVDPTVVLRAATWRPTEPLFTFRLSRIPAGLIETPQTPEVGHATLYKRRLL